MAIGIGLGLARYPFQTVDTFWRWVELCETSGIDSLWQTDRLVSKEPFLECLTAIAAVAGATQRIKFGMNVASVGLRDPLVLAKQCATIDFLSKGRLLPAFGIGSDVAPEWVATGRDTQGRGARTDEALTIIEGLWRGDTVTLQGAHYQYQDAIICPLPVQQPLPLWIGGSSPAAIRRTARFGTGWQAGFESPLEAGQARAAIIAALADTGRSIDPDHYGAGFFFHFGNRDDPVCERELRYLARAVPGRDLSHAVAVGAEEILTRVHDYATNGIAKLILRPLAEDDAGLLDQTRRLVGEILPQVSAQ